MRMSADKTREDIRQKAMQRRVDRAEPELTGRVFVVGEDLQVGELTQQTPRLRDYPAACRRDRHRSTGARDERRTEFTLERADLLRHRRRRQVEAACGFRH